MEKVLNTRIQLKYDSYANWKNVWGTKGEDQRDGFIPKSGEVIFFNVPQDGGAVPQEPAILFKVGDGTHNLNTLPWGSAIAADVYNWAKKASLQWIDIDDAFKTSLQEFVEAHSVNDTYSIVETAEGSNIFQLQKKDKDGTTELVGEQINLSNIYSELNKKVDKEITGTAGKAMIFNEADGGGAKFEFNDGTASYVGVHDKSNGVGAQIYVDKDATTGVIIDVTGDKAYYHKGEFGTAATRDVPENEIATKGDIAAITHPEYTIVKQETAEEGYLSTYKLTKDGTAVGASINIPKDFLVKSASIKTVTEEDVPYEGAKVGDKYIDFVINTKDGSATDEHLYIPVKDLVDPYTAGNGIEISTSNVISTKAVQVRVKAGEELQQANVPVYFDITPAADKVTVNSYSIALGGEDNQTATKYSMEVGCATTTVAGLMSAADKAKLDSGIVTGVLAGNGIDVDNTEATTPKVSVKLDETTSKLVGEQDAHSGLKSTADGLKIDESLTWVFNCGNASNLI